MLVGDAFPLDELGLPERNGPVIVYFYPQAGTPGCTLEAREFNRDIPSHVEEVIERSTRRR
jgi:peroxiredoxin